MAALQNDVLHAQSKVHAFEGAHSFGRLRLRGGQPVLLHSAQAEWHASRHAASVSRELGQPVVLG